MIHQSKDCFLSFITSRPIKLKIRGWNQIVEEKKSLPEPMYFLNIDSRATDLLNLRIKKNIFLSTTTTTTYLLEKAIPKRFPIMAMASDTSM